MGHGASDEARDAERSAPAYLISPVQRALRLLDFVAAGGSTAQLSQIARELDINRVTLARLLDTLEYERMIEASPEGAGYRIGTRFLAMAAAALGERDLLRLAQPVLARLAAELQFSAHLTVLSGDQTVFLLQEVPATLLISNVRVGSRLPAHVTAPGRILLAALPADQRHALLGRALQAAPAQGAQPALADLEHRIDEDAAHGCAWNFSGYEKGVDACAAPVRDRTGRVAAAISVAGPDSRFDAATRARTTRAVIDAARLVSKMLGYRSEDEPSGGSVDFLSSEPYHL